MAQIEYDENPKIAYAQKLADIAARMAKLTDKQREGLTDKIEELELRKSKLNEDQMAAYKKHLENLLQPEKPKSKYETYKIPKQKMEAAKMLYSDDEQEEYETDQADDDDYEEEEPKEKKKRNILLPIILVGLLLVAAAVGGGYLWLRGEIAGNRGNSITATVEIGKGSSVQAIGNALEDAGVIRSALAFRLWVRGQEGLADKLQYGSFELSSNMSYEAITKTLQQTSDDRDTVTVTFPEGIPAVQFAKLLEEAGLCNANDFLEVANNGDFSDLTFWNKRDEKENQFMACEGYLFPNTYQFFAEDDVYNIVRKLYAEYNSHMSDDMYQKIEATGLSLSEFMTLASIVQEEAGGIEHQADVAAIFMNRLAPESPVTLLQSNCSSYIQNENDNNYLFNTVAWYYGDWSQIPQEIIAAYDTYSTPGLPAGPISNPGLDAIANTLRYAESEYYANGYYFFVTDTDGNYYFNKTASAHEAQCAQLRATGKMAG